MYRRARRVALAIVLTMIPAASMAQVVVQPTPAPQLTAENEAWYRAGTAIDVNGGLYERTGAPRAFDPSTMAVAGSYRGVSLYTDTALEEGIVLVPIDAGRVQPYRRQLAVGVPAGTAGCVASVLPVDTAAPMPASTVVGTTGRTIAATTNGLVESAIPPKGLNNAFVEYDGRRWIADGKATALTPDMQPAGTYHGYTVYTRGADRATIYIPSTKDLVVPFTRR